LAAKWFQGCCTKGRCGFAQGSGQCARIQNDPGAADGENIDEGLDLRGALQLPAFAGVDFRDLLDGGVGLLRQLLSLI